MVSHQIRGISCQRDEGLLRKHRSYPVRGGPAVHEEKGRGTAERRAVVEAVHWFSNSCTARFVGSSSFRNPAGRSPNCAVVCCNGCVNNMFHLHRLRSGLARTTDLTPALPSLNGGVAHCGKKRP